MIRKTRLLTPGPTQLHPASLLRAGHEAMHHRSVEFEGILGDVRAGLQRFMRTNHDVVLLPGNGTTMMEASIASLFRRGERVLVVNGGRFGARWLSLALRHELEVVELALPPFDTLQPGQLAHAMSHHADLAAVLLQGVETSTGVLHDLGHCAEVVRERPDCLLIADTITWLGAHEPDPDAIGCDVLLGASQKSLGLDPGLCFASVSERACERMQRVASERAGTSTLDLWHELESQRRGRTRMTPPIGHVLALQGVLQWVDELPRGVESLIGNASMLALAFREAIHALGLKLLPERPANSLTAFQPPRAKGDGVLNSTLVRARLMDRFGITVADGQDGLKGTLLRVGHLGYVDAIETLGCVGALECVLAELGARIEIGAGVAACQRSLQASLEAHVRKRS